MEQTEMKPKLVFFQWNHHYLPSFMKLHMQLHVKCLSEFFDLIVINEDCDYSQVCEKYQPDLTFFEGGYKSSFSRKISITNTSTHSAIPKLGFHNGDPWCDCRPGFLSEMEHWGIETFFSISTTAAEHTPEIADNLYAWPNFIDSDIYKDFSEPKTVPIMFTGSMISLYPWRQKIYKIVSKRYPSVTLPHLGYETHSPLMIYGEQYARAINATWFVPTCGSVAKETVRKHFEVPGAKACLITEKSPSLEAAGFIDMYNCVFANEEDILDKLDHLFKNKEELENIINNGYELVHSQHTFRQRDQILQWFNLNKHLKPYEKIVQLNPFKSLETVSKSVLDAQPIKCQGLHLDCLYKGNEKLQAGKYDEAEVFYLKSLDFISSMSEPKLKLAICYLFEGKVKKAFNWIIQPIHFSLGLYGAVDPDPVEWAYYIIYLLCKGKLNEAVIRANQFPLLNHNELYRTRLVVNLLQNKEAQGLCLDNKLLHTRNSIHQLPYLSFNEWITNICTMLRACHQSDYAETLSASIVFDGKSTRILKKRNSNLNRLLINNYLSIRIFCIEKINILFEQLHMPAGRRGLPSITIGDYGFRVLKRIKISITNTIIKSA